MSKAPVDVIRIVAQPNSLTAPPFPTQSGQTSIAYAVYALNVSSNASVFYVLAITGMCPEIRLQLGQEFSFLDLTSFLLTP
ncbi:MAG TPA: hypothetical protein VN739_04580 [Nitrososphaerales archaeon]|nr:hypothetical protein [Nitrososphaerales archaeon]